MGPERTAVIVLCGGRSRRLPPDKTAADVGGLNLLDRTLSGIPDASLVVCVGPPTRTVRAVVWAREEPPLGGPLAAVEAGLDALPPEVETVLLVGGDMPRAGLASTALTDALTATSERLAVVVDRGGRRQPLLSAWARDLLVGRIRALAPTSGRALSALLDAATPVLVEDTWGASADVDTIEDLRELRRGLGVGPSEDEPPRRDERHGHG
jgi:molybdopterin-guanine dinucleotide biosynthesis protein A